MISDVTIISVSYNSADVFLSSWRNFLENSNRSVVIVDNASSDGSGQILSRTFSGHNVVQMDRNVGYGRAANKGLALCRSRYALLLNPDLTLFEELIDQLLLVAVADDDATAIWAPATTSADCSDSPPVSVDAVCGAAMLFDMEKMKQIGLFDENIFLYSEETDLCYRTRAAGFQVKICPRIYIEHAIDGSSGHHHSLTAMKSYHFGWSRCYYLDKHGLFSAKSNPPKMYREYKIRSYISLSNVQRLRYKWQAAGVRAFMDGEKAFMADGRPQMSAF